MLRSFGYSLYLWKNYFKTELFLLLEFVCINNVIFLRQPFFLYQYSAEAGLLSHKSAGALTTSSPTVWTLSSTYQSK